MVGISKFEYSFSPGDNYISELCDLPQNERCNIINVMLTERTIGQYRFDFLNNQTIVFACKYFNKYNQPVVDTRYVLDGYHQFLPRQIITGNGLPNVKRVDIYQDD